LKRRRGGGRRCGRIEEVVLRATSTFVGTYVEEQGQALVRVDGQTFAEPIVVGDPGAKGARPGDKVVIEMVRFPMHYAAGEAVLTEVLGPRGRPGVDTLTVIHEFDLPVEFPEDALEEARAQAERFRETVPEDRLDLTKETIITIDPVDARDFDDAISLTRSKDGHWRLGVHIADVSHFVAPGGALDAEARKRGNSVYLPQRVIPMLPEILSNSLASLQQRKVRYVKSVFIEYTAEGVPVHVRFANAAIKVTKRFAYEQVMPIVREPERHRAQVSAKVRALLSRMHELAMVLRRRRFEAGALELHLPEVKLDFDQEGRINGAHEAEHDESHEIIEEFMLAANVAVATELYDRGLIFLRRVHGEPDLVKMEQFARFADALGYPIRKSQSRRLLQDLINRVKGKPEERAINYAFLRSMKQAEYSPAELGHYALAEDHYCHFTSPIRRYPDLVVHRLFERVAVLHRRARGESELELAKLGKHCSMTERRAEDAERELIKIKLLEFMAGRIGEELTARITGVQAFGVFCQGEEIPVEGMIHISALDPEDFFDHDEAALSLVGRRSGRTYRLGDPVRVSVVHVDVDRRQIEFRLVEQGPRRKRRRRGE
ncbi:MAG: ribonuclease R, partial [Planctomycetaceae bacterium]